MLCYGLATVLQKTYVQCPCMGTTLKSWFGSVTLAVMLTPLLSPSPVIYWALRLGFMHIILSANPHRNPSVQGLEI